MSENIGHEEAVVGEPASHPHQAVVVGEPPEDVAPVIGEPAFANGLQDQQLTLPSSADDTSANGVQSPPPISFHEEASHVRAPSSGEDNPNVQHLRSPDSSESGIGEVGSHQSEPPVPENPRSSDSHVDEVSSASDAPVVESTDAEIPFTPNTPDAVCVAEEEPAVDIHDTAEVTHIVDSPFEAPLAASEVHAENPFLALDEGSATATGEILTGDTPVTDRANVASGPDETSLKEPADQKEGTPTVQDKQSSQIDIDDGPMEGSMAVNEDVRTTELEQVGQGDTLAREADAKDVNLGKEDMGSIVLEHPLTAELGQASERDDFVQGINTREDVAAGSGTRGGLTREVPQPEVSTTESPTPKKDPFHENHTAPIASELQSTVGIPIEEPPADSSVAPQGTRDMAGEEFFVNQIPAEEASFPPAANGNNGYHQDEDRDCALSREQHLPKDDDGSAEVEKSSSRSKLPLIFTGLAIAAVGVAVASISRPH